MTEIGAFFGREKPAQIVLDLLRLGVCGKSEPATNPYKMCVRHNSRLVKNIADDKISGLFSDTGQLYKLLHRIGENSVKVII